MSVHAHVRAPAVAGRFYPGSPEALRATVDALLTSAPSASSGSGLPAPKGLIVPHAGYVYSGPIVASAYAAIGPRAATIRRVVVLGPAHRVRLRGLAVPEAERFATPLGELEIDAGLVAAALALPQVVRSDQAHALEHSLEVQLPFLQAILATGFTLLPVVVGDASPAEVAELLAAVWGGPETLILISSDLSHYHGYAEARRLDRATAAWLTRAHAPGLDPSQACGARCIDGVLELARRRPLRVRLLDLRSSGDTAGPRDQVVGYGAFAIDEGLA